MRAPTLAATTGLVPTILLSLGVATAPATAQVEYDVGPDMRVGAEPDGRVLLEPHLAAHPTDPTVLVGVAWSHPAGATPSDEHCAVFRSTDSGRTWARHDLEGLGCGDPWVALTDSTAILTALGSHPALPEPDRGGKLVAFFSSDGGESWNSVPQDLGGAHDGPRTSVAPDGSVYVLSHRAVPDATVGSRFALFLGRAWPGRAHVEGLPVVYPSNLNVASEGLAVLSDGTLMVMYSDFQRPMPEGGFRSREGALKTRRTWALPSTDGGRTFSFPRLVTEGCWARPNFTAADASDGPFEDRIYYACEGGGFRSILLAYSADRGERWSNAVPIESPAENDGARTEPQIAVNRDGVLGVAWMDGRDDLSGACYAPYFAASLDGGATFGTPVRVGSELSCPDTDRAGEFPVRRWGRGGDYFGLAAAADGRFHILWPDAREGTFEVWTAAVTVRE